MNKKICTMLVAVVMTASYAQAQLTFGARAGLNLTNMTGKWDHEKSSGIALPGFHAGLVSDYAVNKAFSIQPALVIAAQSSRAKEDGATLKSRLNYIQTPVNAQYKFELDGPKFFVQGGPYFGYALSGKYKIKKTGVSGSENISFGRGDDDVKRFDFGLGAGIGLEYSNIQVAVGYSLGIVNLKNVKGFNTKNKGLWLTLNYFFL